MSIPFHRRGVAVLAAAGVVFTVAILVRGPLVDVMTNPAGFAQAAFQQRTRLAWAGVLGGGVLEVLGLAALYAAIARYHAGSRSARAGWALSTAGIALALTLFGFMAMAAPKVAGLYLQGDRRAMEVVVSFFTSRLSMAILGAMTVAYVLGCLLTAIALWKHTPAPKWAAVAFVLHAPLIALPVPFPLEIAGSVLLLAAALGFLALDGPPPAASPARPVEERVPAGVV
ncbi:MAG: hypothetical protein JWM27_369 [Gemmatimonadetes bacterium]|nr:hypothetical protein [Gemmatimonadota bacterium]